MILSVCHLVDDATIGGINRGLDYIGRCPEIAATASHRIVRMRRGQFRVPPLRADVIVSHVSICWANFPFLTALRAAYPRTPIVHVEHSYSESFVALHVERRDRFDTLMRATLSLFDRVVGVSEQQAGWMLRRGYCPAERLSVIESCSDLAPFLAVPDRVAGDRLVIGAVGRFDVQKGFDILIEAFTRISHDTAELHLYGAGAERADLQARAADHPRIVFKGFASNAADAMAACDLIVMPSRWEPLGVVAVEAMAAGRPVLGSRVDGMATHATGGMVYVGENTPDGWAALLDRLGSLDLHALARRGRDYGATARARFAPAWNALIAGLGATASEPRRAA